MKSRFIHSLWIGLVAGCFGGLVGLGGGVVMIPLMVAVLKITQHRAHGTSLFALVFTGITGAITYGMKGSVDFIASLILAVTAIFTARIGAKFAHSLPEWKLKRAFGAFLIFAALILIAKPYLAELYHFEFGGTAKIITLLVIGIFAGFLAGMMGIGGGTVMDSSACSYIKLWTTYSTGNISIMYGSCRCCRCIYTSETWKCHKRIASRIDCWNNFRNIYWL